MDAAMLAEGQKGVQLYEQGKYEDALAVFKKMEKQIPTDHQVHLCAASLQTLHSTDMLARNTDTDR
jgi:hypothetical protein